MVPISIRVRLITLGFKVLPGTKTLAYGPIYKIQRKWSVVNMTPEAIFTTHNFFHNLQMGPISMTVTFTLDWKGL
jgi:hypothetical protein